MTCVAAVMALALSAAAPPEPAQVAAADGSAWHLIFLAENRPIFVRLRVSFQGQGQGLEASWLESVRLLYASLDANRDGKLTPKEADPATIAALVRLANGGETPKLEPLDVNPKDGVVSVDELAERLRRVSGPFQLQVERQAIGRTDALFEQLDRDKDTELARSELTSVAGSLRPLDFDDDEMISAAELESYHSAMVVAFAEESSERQARTPQGDPVVEYVPGESSLRLARLVSKRYDKGKGDVPGRPDGKLSATEFAINRDAFGSVDFNRDEALDLTELRAFLTQPPIDFSVEINLPRDPSGRAKINVENGKEWPPDVQVKRLTDAAIELVLGQVRIDIDVEEGNSAADEERRLLEQQFKAADANKNGYLEGKEHPRLTGPQSAFAGLGALIDRDSDGKIYLKELIAFADRQNQAARSRLMVRAADQARAIFGILDLDRDRRLGSREVSRALDRVMSWDRDGNGRVSPDEIPYHFQVSIERGGLTGLTGRTPVTTRARTMSANPATVPTAGPDWFQKMDRNHDGDVSRREFLGSREQFDRLDRDQDTLIDPEEARAAVAKATAKAASPAGGKP